MLGDPNTHFSLTNQCLAEENDTLIAQIILDNWDACLSGLEYPDVGIFYYYTDFKEYAGLHNYNIVDELLRNSPDDKHRAFAYCYKIHLAEDAISHNYYVPAVIRKTRLPNWFSHVPAELGIEYFFLNPVANRLMERHSEYDAWFAQVTGKDWSNDAAKLNSIMGGGDFYSKAYTHDSTTWFGNLQNYVYKVVGVFVSPDSSKDYRAMSVDACRSVLRGETSSLNPSGEESLKSADASSQLVLYIITFVVIGIILYLLWRFKLI